MASTRGSRFHAPIGGRGDGGDGGGGDGGGDGGDDGAPPSAWRQIVAAFGFDHVARVEVVTGHAGCRHQGWHVDGVHGVTVIFALVDVDAAKGPTQLDFTVPFNALDPEQGKVKRVAGAPASCRAAMPRGSVLLFNANLSHRGTANLSAADRPVLVLDCSPRSACVAAARAEAELRPAAPAS